MIAMPVWGSGAKPPDGIGWQQQAICYYSEVGLKQSN
jgi:hypothetical protein